jgi:hypothetical protein
VFSAADASGCVMVPGSFPSMSTAWVVVGSVGGAGMEVKPLAYMSTEPPVRVHDQNVSATQG